MTQAMDTTTHINDITRSAPTLKTWKNDPTLLLPLHTTAPYSPGLPMLQKLQGPRLQQQIQLPQTMPLSIPLLRHQLSHLLVLNQRLLNQQHKSQQMVSRHNPAPKAHRRSHRKEALLLILQQAVTGVALDAIMQKIRQRTVLRS